MLGARGDLVSRHTLPALAHLEAEGLLPPALDVVAVDRAATTTTDFRAEAARLLAAHAPGVAQLARRRLTERLHYRAADVATAADLGDAVPPNPCVVYLALPPTVVQTAVGTLGRSGLAPGSRVVVEKPFGTDRGSAAELEALLGDVVHGAAVFRADHFLHHQLLRDVLTVRFGGGLLEPIWDRRHVERVDVDWEEGGALTGRAGSYDRTGALRDMVQSHLLQLVAAVAMEPPASLDAAGLRAVRAELLARVRPPALEELATRTLRGRYTAGVVRRGDGPPEPVRAYVVEPGVDPTRRTETYAEVELRVDGDRWRDVPFRLRTGKAIGAPRHRVQVRFRAGTGPATLTFETGGATGQGATRLSLAAGAGPLSRDTSPWPELLATRASQPLPASALLLRDALEGEGRWFLGREEVDESWRVVDAVLDGWRSGVPPLLEYPAGSAGPRPGPGGPD